MLALFLVVLRVGTEAFLTLVSIAVVVDLFFVLVAVVFCLLGVDMFFNLKEIEIDVQILYYFSNSNYSRNYEV